MEGAVLWVLPHRGAPVAVVVAVAVTVGEFGLRRALREPLGGLRRAVWVERAGHVARSWLPHRGAPTVLGAGRSVVLTASGVLAVLDIAEQHKQHKQSKQSNTSNTAEQHEHKFGEIE